MQYNSLLHKLDNKKGDIMISKRQLTGDIENNSIMSYPLSSGKDGIKIQPDKMEPETLYHCIYQNKIMLVYKDHNEILNCYEIDDDEIVSIVKTSNKVDIEKILEEYIEKENLRKK
jgi:hypothetical protein